METDNKNGFGLIGLLVAVAIIGVLAVGSLYIGSSGERQSTIEINRDALKRAEDLQKIVEERNQRIDDVLVDNNGKPISFFDNRTWQTYHNATYGFEMKYPHEWFVEEKGDGIFFWRKISREEAAANEIGTPFLVAAESTKFTSVQSWFEKEFADRKDIDLLPKKSVAIIGGVEGLRFTDPVSMGGCDEDFVFIRNNFLFRLYRGGSTCDYDDDVYDKIITSFNFID